MDWACSLDGKSVQNFGGESSQRDTTSNFEKDLTTGLKNVQLQPSCSMRADTTQIRVKTHPRVRTALRIIYKTHFYD
jgi:uncharacterized lipoprotein